MKIRRFIKNFASLTLFLIFSSCTKDYIEPSPIKNSSGLDLRLSKSDAVSSELAQALISYMRVFAFSKNSILFPFSHEAPILSRYDNTLRTNMKIGSWDLVLVSAQGAKLITPISAHPINDLKMYEYSPNIDSDGFLNDKGAIELFTSRIGDLEPITVDVEHEVYATVARNVAMIKLVFVKSHGINLSGNHTVELGNVPSTLNWAGGLYPNKENPTLLAAPLKRRFTFTTDPTNPDLSKSDTATYIIPAHRSSDYWLPNGGVNLSAVDTTTTKMTVSVNLELNDGSKFISTKEIPYVAKSNGVMVVTLLINKNDVDISTSVDQWVNQPIDGNLDNQYLNIERTQCSVFGNYPTRINFWTNLDQNNIELKNFVGELSGGQLTEVIANTVFKDLKYTTLDEASGSWYIDFISKPITEQKTYEVYLHAGTIKRVIKVTTYPIYYISDDAPTQVDLSGADSVGKTKFTFTYDNPSAVNFKLGLFAGNILITQTEMNADASKELDFIHAAVNAATLTLRTLTVKFFAGEQWYDVKTIQQQQ